MKTLFLFRHAKSSWAEQGLQDIDRGLNARGIRDAYDTALWLKQKGVSTECMVSSPADRALHTATIISRTLGIVHGFVHPSNDGFQARVVRLNAPGFLFQYGIAVGYYGVNHGCNLR